MLKIEWAAKEKGENVGGACKQNKNLEFHVLKHTSKLD